MRAATAKPVAPGRRSSSGSACAPHSGQDGRKRGCVGCASGLLGHLEVPLKALVLPRGAGHARGSCLCRLTCLYTVFRRDAVKRVDVLYPGGIYPGGIAHVRPMSLVETRRIHQTLFGDVEHEARVSRIERQCAPRDRKQLFIYPQESPKGHNGITDPAAVSVAAHPASAQGLPRFVASGVRGCG